MPAVIAAEVDRVPYFIHHIVDTIAQHHLDVTQETVKGVVGSAITDPQDPWHLRYYRERIDVYYPVEYQSIALACLDAIATSPLTGIDFAAVFDSVKAQVATEDKESVRNVLVLLQRDHYISHNSNSTSSFKHGLIQRYWRFHRGL